MDVFIHFQGALGKLLLGIQSHNTKQILLHANLKYVFVVANIPSAPGNRSWLLRTSCSFSDAVHPVSMYNHLCRHSLSEPLLHKKNGLLIQQRRF